MSEILKNKTVGIIGLGDLGSKLAVQELLSGNRVLAFDSDHNVVLQTNEAVDSNIRITEDLDNRVTKTTLKQLISASSVVHFAVASSSLKCVPEISSDCTVILHDSVMSNSKQALALRDDSYAFVIAHCLMNQSNRVLVSTEFGNHCKVHEHLKSIGLDPQPTTIHQHDTLMARSQGVFALLLHLGLRQELDIAHVDGNLTPSATELRSAVINREASWTKQTIKSILSNPKLLPFVKSMAELLKDS